MATLLNLPAPKNTIQVEQQESKGRPETSDVVVKGPPPYLNRRNFRPKRQSDFGDGGAFPEIDMLQYPLNMGRSGPSGLQTLAIQVDAEGGVDYGAIVQQGRNKNTIVYSQHKDLMPKLDLAVSSGLERKPKEEVEQMNTEIWDIIQSKVNNKLAAHQPKNVPKAPGAPDYIKYKPSQQKVEFNSGAKSRIIQMQEMAVDPLDPPKFRVKRVPRQEDANAVPIMHSPPRPVSKDELRDWQIPPCISNWKNAKGYTIPLDKRLAADGRGLVTQTINDRFAPFREALHAAEQHSNKETQLAAQLKKQQAHRQREEKERQLRELAIAARREKKGGLSGIQSRLDEPGSASEQAQQQEDAVDLPPPPSRATRDSSELDLPPLPSKSRGRGERSFSPEDDRSRDRRDRDRDRNREHRERESKEEREARRERDDIRYERKRERDREHRLDIKRSKLSRDKERDISEQVALGLPHISAKGIDSMYDSRLFNQDAGIESGFGADDAYNLYSTQWQTDRSGLNRITKVDGQDEELGRFKPDKGFEGADYNSKESRDNVEFEKQKNKDLFDLDTLF